jgi:hypothetical protein
MKIALIVPALRRTGSIPEADALFRDFASMSASILPAH